MSALGDMARHLALGEHADDLTARALAAPPGAERDAMAAEALAARARQLEIESEPQHMVALRGATEVRCERAELKRRIRAPRDRAGSAVVLASILAEGVPRVLAGMNMDALTACVFKASPQIRRWWIAEAETSSARLLGALSSRQLGLFVAALQMDREDLEARAWARSRGRAA